MLHLSPLASIEHWGEEGAALTTSRPAACSSSAAAASCLLPCLPAALLPRSGAPNTRVLPAGLLRPTTLTLLQLLLLFLQDGEPARRCHRRSRRCLGSCCCCCYSLQGRVGCSCSHLLLLLLLLLLLCLLLLLLFLLPLPLPLPCLCPQPLHLLLFPLFGPGLPLTLLLCQTISISCTDCRFNCFLLLLQLRLRLLLLPPELCLPCCLPLQLLLQLHQLVVDGLQTLKLWRAGLDVVHNRPQPPHQGVALGRLQNPQQRPQCRPCMLVHDCSMQLLMLTWRHEGLVHEGRHMGALGAVGKLLQPNGS
mmetsp:Transcript_19157/g.41372  ORF Transcript_19157/g.41372 Transcript_19157/m.41372 type:complete len:307 (-) Transcript_19157:965-1885(-)